MKKVEIFVVTHKPAPIPKDDVLVPLHVGRALSSPIEGIIGDDTGDNISEKNLQYCEMTAHYWILRNVRDTEYVGVCHYRRYFGIDITAENIDEVMGDANVLMVEPSWYIDSVFSYFAKYIGAENMTILWMVMKKMYPEYVNTFEYVCNGVKFYPFNMLLCRISLFDEYAEWIFSVLDECEKYVKPSPYKNARRALAYMAELLTGVYFIHKGLKIKPVPYRMIDNGESIQIVRTEEENSKLSLYETLLQNELEQKVKEERKERFLNPAILLGLKNDGINIE